jgi:hypothetical protein
VCRRRWVVGGLPRRQRLRWVARGPAWVGLLNLATARLAAHTARFERRGGPAQALRRQKYAARPRTPQRYAAARGIPLHRPPTGGILLRLAARQPRSVRGPEQGSPNDAQAQTPRARPTPDTTKARPRTRAANSPTSRRPAGAGVALGQSVRHRSKPRACELRSVRDLNEGHPRAGVSQRNAGAELAARALRAP